MEEHSSTDEAPDGRRNRCEIDLFGSSSPA